jgi:hypothetical protein
MSIALYAALLVALGTTGSSQQTTIGTPAVTPLLATPTQRRRGDKQQVSRRS